MEPLVLFHGFSGRGSSWDAVLTALMEQGLEQPVDGWSPDLPGHGSSSEVQPESFEATVKVLGKSIRKRYGRPVVLAGYSMGARLALGVAIRFPELVRELVLMGVQPGIGTTEDRRSRADADAELSERLVRDGLESFVSYWQALPLFADQKELPAEVLVKQRQTRMSHQPKALAWALRILSPGLMPDYRPRLKELAAVPVTLVTGDNDAQYRRIAEEMALSIPHARHESVPACGHNPVLARPEAVADILARTLGRETALGRLGEESP